MGSTLKFTVEVAADQATQALNAISTAVNQTGVQMRTSLLGVRPAAQAAGKEISGLSEHIRGFAAEQRGQERVASFFVRGLSEIAPVSEHAKIALGGITGALVGGAGIGMAFDLAVTALQFFRAETVEAEKALTKTHETISGVGKQWDEYAKSLTTATGAAKLYAETNDTLAGQLRKAKEALDSSAAAAQHNLEVISGETSAGAMETLKALGSFFLQTGAAAETAAQQVKALTDAIAVNDAVAQEAQKKEQEKLADNAIKRIKEEEKRKAEARQKAAKEEALRVAKSGDQAVLSRLKEGQDYDQSEAEGNALIEKQRAERLAKAQKEYNDELADSIALAQRWGSALGNVFAQLAAGQMSASDAIRAVMGEVIKSVIQSAITQITANAAVAGTEAAKSQAGIPVVGPALAVGALSAMSALILSQLGSLPSAAKGWSDTGAYEGLMYVHKREAVLDQQTANDWRAGRGGGTSLNVALSVVDSRGFERVMSDNRGPVLREQRKLMRRRRRG